MLVGERFYPIAKCEIHKLKSQISTYFGNSVWEVWRHRRLK